MVVVGLLALVLVAAGAAPAAAGAEHGRSAGPPQGGRGHTHEASKGHEAGRAPTKGRPAKAKGRPPAREERAIGRGAGAAPGRPAPPPPMPPASSTQPDVLGDSVARSTPAVAAVAPPRRPRAAVRPAAAVTTTAAAPPVALVAPPQVVAIQPAAAEPVLRRVWPTLPGAAGHPAFPVLLAAVLLAVVALGFRGDRRDPKLRYAAIDDRDDRARFP